MFVVAQCDAELLVADGGQRHSVAPIETAREDIEVRVEGRPVALVEGTAVVSGGVIDRVVGGRTAAHVVLVVQIEHGVVQIFNGDLRRNQPVVALSRGVVVIDEVVAAVGLELPRLVVGILRPSAGGEAVGIEGEERLNFRLRCGRGHLYIVLGAQGELVFGVIDAQDAVEAIDLAGVNKDVAEIGVVAGTQRDARAVEGDGAVGGEVVVGQRKPVVRGIELAVVNPHQTVDVLGSEVVAARDLDRVGYERIVGIRHSVLADVARHIDGGDAAHGTLIDPADLVLVMVVAHNQPFAVQIDGLSHGEFVEKAGAVDGNLDAAGLILDGEVLVAVAALVRADHHRLHDEGVPVMADGVLRAYAQRRVHGLDVGDGLVRRWPGIDRCLEFRILPAVAS